MDIPLAREMVAREQEAFRAGFTAAALMEAAGATMAERITGLYPHASAFLVFVGKGNNGGDGLVVARHLATPGHDVEVVLTAPEAELGELPIAMLTRLRKAAPDVEIAPWSDGVVFPYSGDVVIDGLLGLQARGPLRGNLGEVVAAINAARERNFFRTVALDLPSGLAAYEEGPRPARAGRRHRSRRHPRRRLRQGRARARSALRVGRPARRRAVEREAG
ncbi:MAG: NAD(P)H-hydrate epimerase [Verrucomicrobiota bacterium]